MCPAPRKSSAKPSAASSTRSSGRATGPGRPKDLGKRAAILEAAKTLFVEQGYNGVSMDSIASQAGVSKLTVYSHFGDKETLFTEAVKSKCEQMLPDTLFLAPLQGPVRDQLLDIGSAFFQMVTSEAAVAVQRVMMAPDTDERLRTMFWQAGPQRTTDVLAELLRARSEAGELEIGDCALAAQQFLTLVKGELHTQMMCGRPPTLQETDGPAHVAACVDFFLRAYASGGPSRPPRKAR